MSLTHLCDLMLLKLVQVEMRQCAMINRGRVALCVVSHDFCIRSVFFGLALSMSVWHVVLYDHLILEEVY